MFVREVCSYIPVIAQANGQAVTKELTVDNLIDSHMTITKDTVIGAFSLFGGVDIRVPEDVQVKIKSGFIFGGVSDERKGDASKGKYTIYLDAAGGFGGVEIKDKIKSKK